MPTTRRTEELLFTTSNGIQNLSMLEINPQRYQQGQPRLIPCPENSWAFTNLASAINIGLEILESPGGRSALLQLGLWRVQILGRHVQNEPCYRGGEAQMRRHVDHFLARVRTDFPMVHIDDIGSANVTAACSREVNLWSGDLQDYWPKAHAVILFNHCRVTDMIRASHSLDKLEKSRDTEEGRRHRKILLLRHKYFQFIFGVAVAHELCHALSGYIVRHRSYGSDMTPRRISHLSYGEPPEYSADQISTGESGRWFENFLLGGSVEYYRNDREGDGQAGVPYLIDSDKVAWKISSQSILSFVEGRRQFQFPLQTTGNGMHHDRLYGRGIIAMGGNMNNEVYLPDLTFMRARHTRPLPMYNVSQQELDRVPDRPRIVRAIRVA